MDRVEFCLATGHQTTIPDKQLLMFVAILRVNGVGYRNQIHNIPLDLDINECLVNGQCHADIQPHLRVK
jgi:hypothetical protein